MFISITNVTNNTHTDKKMYEYILKLIRLNRHFPVSYTHLDVYKRQHFNESVVEVYVKLRRLPWAGHVVRMNDNEHLKESLWGVWMRKDQKAIQGKDWKMLSLWMQEKCWGCEYGSPLLLIERGGQGSR